MDHAEPAVAGDLEGRAAPWREPVRGGHPAPSLAARSGVGFLRGWLTGELPQPPLSRLLGMRMVGFGAGSATFTMPLSRAHARLIHGGRRIAVAGADVVDADGRAIAVATGSALSERGFPTTAPNP